MSVLQSATIIVAAVIIVALYRRSERYHIQNLNISYDYIIVGSGSAGSVLASRLSDNPNVTVLVVEAGSIQDDNPLISTPGCYGLLQHSELDWNYFTMPQGKSQFGLHDNKSYWPRGRLVGGSSMLNALVYIRGSRYDYDGWASNGCDGWSYQEVLPYFLKSEDILIPSLKKSDYHSKGGPLKITESSVTPIEEVFRQAGQELGEEVLDCNGERQEGFCTIQSTKTMSGVRSSTYEAFLKPILNRKNLHLSSESLATKIIIDDKKVKGVEFVRKGRKLVAKAEKEVILSTGSVETPHLLMLSGIGPKEHLDQFEIPVIADLPVGNNLQDHLMLLLYSCINGTESITTDGEMAFGNKMKYAIFGAGSLTLAGAIEGTAFLRSGVNAQTEAPPDIQLGLQSVTVDMANIQNFNFVNQTKDYYLSLCPGQGFFTLVVLLHGKSRGTLRLRSKDPFDDPLIDPKYLDHPDDIKTLIRGVRYYQKLMDTTALKKIGTQKQTKPLPMCSHHVIDSDDYWECFIRHAAVTVYHPTSTAKMGSTDDIQTVVDPQLRVRGIHGLRVADASVMPEVISGNTNAPTIMIAEKASDLILGKKLLSQREL